MNSLTTNTDSCIKMQSAVLLYMLNLGRDKEFEAESNGRKILCKSNELGLVKFKNKHHYSYGLKAGGANETMLFMEPIFVESFPDKSHILSFHCNEIKVTATNEEFTIEKKTHHNFKLAKKIFSLFALIIFLFAFTVNNCFSQNGYIDGPNQWTQSLSGVGPIYGIAVNPINQNIVYAVSNTNGVYKTINAGLNWTAVNNGLTNTNIFTISICESYPDVIMIGTTSNGTDPGIYKTTNGGQNWARIINGISDVLFIQKIKMHPSNPDIAWVCIHPGTSTSNSTNGLYKTTNGGIYWFVSNSGFGDNKNTISIAINPLNPDNLYCGTTFRYYSGMQWGPTYIYRSDNGGTSWYMVNNGLPTQTYDINPVRVLSVSSLDPSVVLAGLYRNGDPAGVYVTTNGGQNWQQRNSGLPSAQSIRGGIIKPGSASEFFIGHDGYFVGNSCVYRTTNAGLSWTSFHGGSLLSNNLIRDFAFKTFGDTTLYAGGACTSTAGQGVFEYSWPSVAPPPFLYSPQHNVIITQPVTFKWYKSNTATSYRLQIATDSLFNNIVVNDSLLTDTMKIINGLSVNTWHYWRVNAKNAHGWGQWSSVWKFAPVNSIPAAPVLNYPANNTTISLPVSLKWFKSDWTSNYTIQIATDSLFSNIVVNDSLLIDTTKAITNLQMNILHYWRVNAKNIIGTSPWSAVWRFTPANIPTAPLLYLPLQNSAVSQPVTFKWFKSLFAGTYRLQVATDAGFNSIVYNDSTITDTLKILTNFQGNVWHHWRVNAKNNNGISNWSDVWMFLPSPVTGITGNVKDIPISYSLSQNYPNPFNPVTKINFAIPKQEFIHLKIYDILGKEVKILVSEIKSPGYYSVDFDGSELTSGTYFCRISAGDFTDIKKIVLIK